MKEFVWIYSNFSKFGLSGR